MTRRDESYRVQPSLFDLPSQAAVAPVPSSAKAKAITRPSHPETSLIAATELAESGRLASHSAEALELVRQHPGRTGYELDELGGTPDRYRKRLAGLADKGFVRRGEKRVCEVKGSLCVTWFPVDETRLSDE